MEARRAWHLKEGWWSLYSAGRHLANQAKEAWRLWLGIVMGKL